MVSTSVIRVNNNNNNNNNNMLAYKAPVCQRTSEAPKYVE